MEWKIRFLRRLNPDYENGGKKLFHAWIIAVNRFVLTFFLAQARAQNPFLRAIRNNKDKAIEICGRNAHLHKAINIFPSISITNKRHNATVNHMFILMLQYALTFRAPQSQLHCLQSRFLFVSLFAHLCYQITRCFHHAIIRCHQFVQN